jgi:hypothetical protein
MSRTAAARPRPGALVDGARRLSEHPAFDRAIVAVILFNAAVLGAGTYDSVARRHGELLDLLNEACLAVFVVELVIRFLAAGANPRRYLSSGWNVFDFVVVGAAFVPGLGTNSTLLRLARLLRVVRVVRLLPDLRVLVVAVGRAALVRPEMVKEGAVVVDVGMNRGEGRPVGDVDPAVAERAGLYTPVPGGVGPMTIATLLANTVLAAKYRRGLLAFPGG